ncbi:MMPL family transporter [Streptomyces aureus]|uniref:MMPL family transporter n=1 Tax=Streptomyces aureus TaxID=193461 RepID=UPI000563C28C|nr:MMPL family transporter [Streptomyces aureus]
MATYLYRLARFAFRRRRITVLVWLALLAVAGVGAATASSATSATFSLPGTESQQAFDLIEKRFPNSSADGATARVVLRAADGQKLTAAVQKDAVREVVADLGSGSGQVAAVADPYQAQAVSKDGSTAYVSVTYKVTPPEVSDATRDALKEAGQRAEQVGLKVEIGGDALTVTPAPGAGEIVGVVIAGVVLVITFGSLVAAGLPLLTAMVGVGIGISVITALSSALDLGSTTSTLAMMIGLAVGIDYALFIVSRYRAEVAGGKQREEAVGHAVGTAGSAVVFAGLTVIIALAGLSVVGVPMLTKMGLAAAGAVVVAVLIALTLVPALLGFAGSRVTDRKAKTARRARSDANAGSRWARFVLRRPLMVLLTGVLGLAAIAVPAASLQLGLPDDGAQPSGTTQRKAYDLLSDNFGPGFNGPLLVVVDGDRAAGEQAARTITGIDGVTAVGPPRINAAGDTSVITVIPQDRPSSASTEDLVHEIRNRSEHDVLVTGTTALNIDFSQKMNSALMPYLSLVVGLAFLLLMVVFRSILVPLKAALGFLLSVVAALGAVVAVFQWGWLGSVFGVEQTGPIMSMMPIFMIGVVFGLAMDYEVFLVSRMREAYVHGERPHDAVVTGFRHGARVVTAAAIIMIAVFAGFIGSGEQMIKMIGFGLAVAVFFDAFVVRMAIVPAVLALLGHRAWWLPRRLERALPDFDVEGEGLSRTPRKTTAAAPDHALVEA